MSAKPPGLSTHVLDQVRGGPAAGVPIALWRIEGAQRTLLVETRTDADGRTKAPLLDAASFRPGTYELVFESGAYFRAAGIGADPPFHDRVTVRVTLGLGYYHVPLLVSPFAYSTYRGS